MEFPNKIEFIPSNNKWIIRYISNEFNEKIKYVVSIKPKQNITTLFLNIKEVELESNSLSKSDYALLWKALEHHLNENKIKADLVQFSGYYQYKNDIEIQLNINAEFQKEDAIFWNLLEKLNNDSFIGRIEPIEFYSEYFEASNQEVSSFFRQLREIGFEIRNTNTNPEIAENNYLIPYKFPTLTPLSVQLSKSL